MSLAKKLTDTIQVARSWHRLDEDTRSRYPLDKDRMLRPDPGIDAVVPETVAWLHRAQALSKNADGGVARHYSIIDGWGSSYPETTGYIIPTVINYARQTDSEELLQSARDMLDWLVRIQLPDGAFQGGTVDDRPIAPTVFNTGQILVGLSAGSSEFGEPYTEAMHRAGRWLADCQDDDGCWRKNQSPFALAGEKTYDTHTAWGLIEATRACGDESYAEAALRNIRWAVSKQRANGWFEDCCLTDPSVPLTHTIGYALRGVIEGYLISQDRKLLDAAMLTANSLLSTIDDGGFIPGRLDSNWRPAVKWCCLTGSVQIAICWLLLHIETGSKEFLEAAQKANRYVRRTVDMDGPDGDRGGIRGSFPVHGSYGQYQYLNWAAKFFVDSNLLEKKIIDSGT